MMINNGSKLKHLEAQIFGGAYNPEISLKDIGLENVLIARKVLAKKRSVLSLRMWVVKKGERLSLTPTPMR
jgi:chemotaxis receptor (MCP) glutamine deamidase CheD